MKWKKIKLTRGCFAKVDIEDYDKVSSFNWHLLSGKYAARSVGGRKNKKIVLMHRYIMEPPKGLVIDHINHDTLDNRKKNLRVCSYSNNQMNRSKCSGKSSKFKGVSLCKFTRKWECNICFNGKRRKIGRFADEVSAAKAYDREARKIFGRFALTNKKLGIL